MCSTPLTESNPEFYEKWHGVAAKWVKPGLFDYGTRHGLKSVEAAVKAGDYAASGKA
jgi:hypothetical protein